MRGRLRRFFDTPWRLISFQVILYPILWGATLRIILSSNEPIRFETISPHLYLVWCGLNLVCPPLAGVSWWLIIHRAGRARFAGIWLRAAADFGMFVALLAFHVSGVYAGHDDGEPAIYMRYITAAVLLFMAMLVIRDAFYIGIVERLAARMRRRD